MSESAPQVSLEKALKMVETHINQGKLLLAERIIDDILKVIDDHAPVWNYRGVIAFQRGEIAESAQYFGKAVAADKEEALYHNNYATMLFETNRQDLAIEHWKKACSWIPRTLQIELPLQRERRSYMYTSTPRSHRK